MAENAAPSAHLLEQSLVDLTTDSWRLARTFSRLLSKLDAGEANRYVSQLRYFEKRLEEALGTAELTIVNLEGQLYDGGIAASALNLADFTPDDALVVEQMVEPIIMGREGIRKTGTVILKKVGS